MKIFRVVTEYDGETTKKPGETTTELKNREYRYAAEDIEQVWEAFRVDPEETLIAIHEEHPSIIII
jgi:hypothetical protein